MSDNNKPRVVSTSFNQINKEVNETIPMQKLVLKSDGTVEVAETSSLPNSSKIEVIGISVYENFYPVFALILLVVSVGTGIGMTAYTFNIFIGSLCGFVVLAASIILLKVIAPEGKKYRLTAVSVAAVSEATANETAVSEA